MNVGDREIWTPYEVDRAAREQYQSSSGVNFRLELINLYAESQLQGERRKYKQPRTSELHLAEIHHKQIEALHRAGVEKDATVVVFGCGDGSDVLSWTLEHDHTGRVIGVNLDPIYDLGVHIAAEEGYGVIDQETLHLSLDEINIARLKKGQAPLEKPQVAFLPKSAAETNLPENCADVVTINFLLYHVGDPDSILREAVRILKPGGKVAIATRDIMHMLKLWNLAEIIGEKELDADVSPSFYHKFNLSHLFNAVSRYFTIMSKYSYHEEERLLIPLGAEDKELEGRQLYRNALLELTPHITLRSFNDPSSPNFQKRAHPSPSQMIRAMNARLDPVFESEVRATSLRSGDTVLKPGYFTDFLDQHYVIGINDKK